MQVSQAIREEMYQIIVLEFHASEASREMIGKLLWANRDDFLKLVLFPNV